MDSKDEWLIDLPQGSGERGPFAALARSWSDAGRPAINALEGGMAMAANLTLAVHKIMRT